MKLKLKREFVSAGDNPREDKAFDVFSVLSFRRKACNLKKRSIFCRFSVDKTQ